MVTRMLRFFFACSVGKITSELIEASGLQSCSPKLSSGFFCLECVVDHSKGLHSNDKPKPLQRLVFKTVPNICIMLCLLSITVLKIDVVVLIWYTVSDFLHTKGSVSGKVLFRNHVFLRHSLSCSCLPCYFKLLQHYFGLQSPCLLCICLPWD